MTLRSDTNSNPDPNEILDVIAVGAHPDDVEIGCGGILAMLSRQGFRVGIVDLTDGEPTPGSPGPEFRLAEAREAAEILGVKVRYTLPLPNRRLFDDFESRVALAKLFRIHRPKIVLGIVGKTPTASPDHWQASQITDAAVFYSRLSKWDDFFDSLAVHTISKQYWYQLGSASLEIPNTAGHFVVDISPAFQLKLQAIRAYKSQFPPSKERVFQMVAGQNQLAGISAGFEYGEILYSTTTIGTRDLMTFAQQTESQQIGSQS